MTRFASMTASPSHTYGRHHRSNANSTMIQAPHATVEKASASPMTGEPSSTSSDGFVPAQYSIENRIVMNTIALPRSGCLMTSSVGRPAMTQGHSRSRRVAGASRRSASQRASIRITASLASSAGWPSRRPPIVIQDRSLAAVPAPVPTKSVNRSTNTLMPKAYGVAHSSNRGDVRNISTTATSPTPSQISCLCQIVATNVGTSVCPAEYSVASPYAARATTTAASGLSISRSGGRIGGRWVGVRWRHAVRGDGGPGIERCNGGVLFRGAGQDLHRVWRGIGWEHDPHLRRESRVHPEIVADHAGHERCHVGALACELHDCAHDDLRFLGRCKSNEPAVRRPVRVLRRTGFAGDRDAAAEPPRASRRATLHHTDHRLPQSRELLGREGEA